MASRGGARNGTPRRSPRISSRSGTPASPSRRLLSPELVEQLTPRRSRLVPPAFSAVASGSNIGNIKQEDTAASFYIRERTQEETYQPALLRGDQRSFSDSRDANASLSASLSIFSSEGDQSDNYQQEEREMAQMQNAEQSRPASRATMARRTSGQRRGRTSADDLPYTPQADDEDDEDDDLGESSMRARRKGRNSNSISARLQGKIDNQTWMTAARRKGRRKSVNGVPGEYEEDDSQEINDDEDTGAASGKETRFDGASDSDLSSDQDDGHEVALGNHTLSGRLDKQQSRPEVSERPSRLTRLASAAASWLYSLPAILYKLLISLCNIAASAVRTSRMLQWALLTLAAASLAWHLLGTGNSASQAPHVFHGEFRGNDHRHALSLDKENQRLRTELARLTSRLDSLSSSIDSQITSSLSKAAAAIQASADARQSTELNRITASTKRQISRLAQEELKSIQSSVSSSVELMLRDLDKKIHTQLTQRADDTEGKFFAKLEREVSQIAKYANNEVNARLGQAFDATFLNEIIESRLETYARDRTGKIDWAAVTSGAWIGEEGTVHRGYRLNSVWNVGKFLAEGRRVPIGEPVKAITPGRAGLGVGNCWMTGWGSFLEVNLAEPKVVEEVVVEHALPGMRRTAPRRIMVWGKVDEGDRQYYRQWRRSKGVTQDEYMRALLPDAYWKAIPDEYKHDAPLLLAYFEFKATGSTLQTFNLTDEARVYPFGIHAVRWQFVDGWAKAPPICIHRVRVHGSDWPVFADKQVN